MPTPSASVNRLARTHLFMWAASQRHPPESASIYRNSKLGESRLALSRSGKQSGQSKSFPAGRPLRSTASKPCAKTCSVYPWEAARPAEDAEELTGALDSRPQQWHQHVRLHPGTRIDRVPRMADRQTPRADDISPTGSPPFDYGFNTNTSLSTSTTNTTVDSPLNSASLPPNFRPSPSLLNASVPAALLTVPCV